jgi:RHS repeat-associated protein
MRKTSRRARLGLALALAVGLALTVQPAGALAGTLQPTLTFDSSDDQPKLSLTLAESRTTVIPGDQIVYSGQVSNSGDEESMGTHSTVAAPSGASYTVASFFHQVETCASSCTSPTAQWTALAGFGLARSGYTPGAAPAASSGLTLASTPIASGSVTYPGALAGGVVGTRLMPNAIARWTNQAKLSLTSDEEKHLCDSSQVQAMRYTIHFEMTSTSGLALVSSGTQSTVFSDPFWHERNCAAISNVVVTVTPASGPKLVVDKTTDPGLAMIKPGDSVPYSTTWAVPVPAPKGSGESDSAYLARLTALNGLTLQATATASGTAGNGKNVTAPAPPPVRAVEHLPILGIAKAGPSQVNAGSVETNPLAIQNNGGDTASNLVVVDNVPNGGQGTVTGVPATLAAGGNANAQATFPVPANQPDGGLTDTAMLTWQDANANLYGPISSAFTTTVITPLTGAKLTLAPASAGPDVTGTSQKLTATLVDSGGVPMPNRLVNFAVTGANPGTGSGTTDATGTTSFTYTGATAGTDVVQASVTSGSFTLQSNTSTIIWITPPVTGSTTPVQGNFYAEPTATNAFVAKPGDTAAFGQTFPDIEFNPPAGAVNHNISGVGPTTRPFTDVVTDPAGNFMGTIVAQGNSVQAGVGTLTTFDAVFTSSFVIAKPGDVTFNVIVNDGFLLGIGGAATRVSGTYVNPPPSNTSPFNGYNLVGAFNQPGATSPQTFPVTVHFPAAGTYPYELDYFSCCNQQLSLTMTVATFTADTSPLSVYAGYADGLRPAGSIFPFPWQGSPGVANFIGSGATPYDSGAIRFDNNSDNPITLSDVAVDVGATRFDLWGTSIPIAPHTITILTQTSGNNFDSSDVPKTCTPTGVIPQVHFTQNGATTTFADTTQVLNTKGIDPPSCGGGNESVAWTRIGGSGSPVNVPMPPATTLIVSPPTVPGNTVGRAQTVQVAALDASGLPVANLPVTLVVFGPNTQQLQATTGANGTAIVSYLGSNAGTDTVQATALISSLRSVSNNLSVNWTIPVTGPPPTITNLTPADGSTVTKSAPVSATCAPPGGQTIASWNVTQQGATAAQATTLASGTGTPPSPWGTFDPTLVPNDTYSITVTCVASGGGTQSLSASVLVPSRLKVGRYVTTYQDLRVPVNGLQMTVNRTYDSTDKRVGDFGVGWRIDLSSVRVGSNGPLGSGNWSVVPQNCSLLCFYRFVSATAHVATVTYPDGRQEIFDFTPANNSNVLLYFEGTAGFTARAGTGTTSTLTALDSAVTYGLDGTIQGSNGKVYAPTRFQLTTHDGNVLVLDTSLGLVSQTDRNGNSLNVDASGIHASNGQSVNFARDAQGRITDISGPATLHYDYSAAGDLADFVDPRGSKFAYTYDANHDLLTTPAGGGQPASTLTYDSSGRLVSVTDANGHTTAISNDVAGQKQVVTDALGLKTTIYTYDDLGNIAGLDVIAGGNTTSVRTTYDSGSHPLSYTDALGHTTTTTYDTAGNATQTTDAFGSTTGYVYDPSGALLFVIDSTGKTVESHTYDTSGNLLTVNRADGKGASFQYDSAGRMNKMTDPLGHSMSYAFDANGHLSAITDSLGTVSHYVADASGRVTSVTSSAGTTTYTYDPAGNATAVKDTLGQAWQLAYDVAGRLTSRTDPLGHATTFQYDAAGQLSLQANRLGQSTTFTYDADGQQLQKASSTGDTTGYTYDAAGRLVDTHNETADVSFGYDALNHVVSETSKPVSGVGLPTVTFSGTFDAAGDRLTRTGPDGTTQYTYDVFGQLASLTDPASGTFQIGRDGIARLTSLTRPNGVTDTLAYDVSDHLTSRTAALGGTTVASTAYTYDGSGRRVTSTDAAGTNTYTYDAGGQLLTASHPAGTPNEAYTYDAAGNRTSSAAGSYGLGAGDRLLSDPAFSYTYDLEGRLVARTSLANGSKTTFDWNTRDQVTAIHYADGTTTAFRYDPLGRRVEINAAGTITRYGYDGMDIAVEYTGTNAIAATYEQLPTTDQPLEMVRNGVRSYYLVDGQGSVTGLTDASGTLVATYRYNSFGAPVALTGSIVNPFTYAGLQYDAKSGLYYDRARWYDPGTGRFTSEDPKWHVNPYPYAGSSPLDLQDTTGADVTVEYAFLLDNQLNRALGIARLNRCLWLCVVTGLKDFQGLPAADVYSRLSKAFENFLFSQADYPNLAHPKGKEVATGVVEKVLQSLEIEAVAIGDGELELIQTQTITVSTTEASIAYHPPYLSISGSITTTSYTTTTIIPWSDTIEDAFKKGVTVNSITETFHAEC